ncbi:hypothetical protein D3C87_80380 [compost metagenome]
MIKVEFKTLIPKPVKDWIYEREFEDHLLESEKRLKRALSNFVPQFKETGFVYCVKLENGELIGDCSVIVGGENELEARQEFKNHFGQVAKRQKFKLVGFKKVDD